jgi:membrane protein DedA with SNARE-associated domain
MNMGEVLSLSSLIAFFEASKYFLLFAGSYLEGTVVMLTGGLLWREGIVAFWPAYLALVLGDFLSDLMWYCIGYFAARPFITRVGKYFNVTPPLVQKAERRFHRHHTWILVISKLTMGFGLAVATLMTAGMLRIPLSRYITINLLGGIVWVFLVMTVGYYFGNVLDLIPTKLKIIASLTVIIGFFFGVRALSVRLAKSNW